MTRKMNSKIQFTFLDLILLQAAHSAEEFVFRFYDRFPPMKFLYRGAPDLAGPAFLFANTILIMLGLACYFYWVRPGRAGARRVIWAWVIIESFNVIAHLVWAVMIRGDNPGLVTVTLFIPLLLGLSYRMPGELIDGVAEQSIAADARQGSLSIMYVLGRG